METKYYRPTTDEFYVGFEYEKFEDNEWKQTSIKDSDTLSYFMFNIADNVFDDVTRVKYLDKEDIESLGWNFISYDEFQYGEYELYWRDDLQISILKQPEFLFQGIINNKSELIKLLKQLGIYESKSN